MDKDIEEDTLSFTGIVQCYSQTSPGRRSPPAPDPFFSFFSDTVPSPSPADHLFSNGHLLPHNFADLPAATKSGSRHYSPAQSISTSTSTASRSSSSGSGSGGRRYLRQGSGGSASKGWKSTDSGRLVEPRRVSFRLLGPMPAPALAGSSPTGRGSGRPRSGGGASGEAEKSGRGFFGSIVSACRQCHALEPSSAVRDVGVRAEYGVD